MLQYSTGEEQRLGIARARVSLICQSLATNGAICPPGVLQANLTNENTRKSPLVVAASCFMVLEMILLSVAPLHGGTVLLLLCCLANRILSGMAEGMANGADEALVFDSLAERDRSGEWPEVLDQVMRWQAVGMVIAMLVGGAIYDPAFVGRLCSSFGWRHTFVQGTTLEIPKATFGVIGATMGGLGLAVSPRARRMVSNNSVARNYGLLALTVLAGLIGVSCRWPYWGVLFIVPLAGAMMALDYIVSYYLNAIVGSSHRATVLSFKGVAFNLGYGFISLIFALVLKAVRAGGSTGVALQHGLVFLPFWTVCGCIICGFVFWRQQIILRIRL